VQPADTSKIHNCIPDEHYVQTLLAVRISFSFCEHYCISFKLNIKHLLKKIQLKKSKKIHCIYFKLYDVACLLLQIFLRDHPGFALIFFLLFVFFFPNLAKRPRKRNNTKISDTYCMGYFQLQRS